MKDENCKLCGKYEIFDEDLCEDCFHDTHAPCEDCGEIVKLETDMYIEEIGGYLCNECFKRYLKDDSILWDFVIK